MAGKHFRIPTRPGELSTSQEAALEACPALRSESKRAGVSAFEHAKFGPDRQVVRDALGLLEREIVLAEKIEYAAAAVEFRGGSLMEQDVVVLSIVKCVGRRF